jgi:Zn finger protein HypA/HybF involved in hydrogenase expression
MSPSEWLARNLWRADLLDMLDIVRASGLRPSQVRHYLRSATGHYRCAKCARRLETRLHNEGYCPTCEGQERSIAA